MRVAECKKRVGKEGRECHQGSCKGNVFPWLQQSTIHRTVVWTPFSRCRNEVLEVPASDLGYWQQEVATKGSLSIAILRDILFCVP